MRKLNKIVALSLVVSLTACQAQNNGGAGGIGGIAGIDKEMIGGIIGAASGAAIGSNVGGGKGKIAAIAIGTLLGSKLGSSVGESLDRADMTYYNRASQSSLETGHEGETFPWRNPETGNSGTVTPARYYKTEKGRYCREYTQTINVGGRIEEAYGTACRQDDGTWRIIDNGI